MPAALLPADKLTHAIAGACVAVVLLPFGVLPAVLACVLAAVGREVYAWRQRGWTMTRKQAIEHAADILCTLAGGALVLAAALIGV